MLMDVFFSIIDALITALDFILPDYSLLPFPEDFVSSVATIFSYMVTFMQLPLIRVFADFFTDFLLPFAFIMFLLYIGKKFINFLRGAEGI